MREEVVHAVDRVDLAIARGRGRRPGRRIRLRQVDARPPRRRPAAADRRRAPAGAAQVAGAACRAATRARQQLKMQMIFQDPYASLNPRMRVVDIVGEAPVAHGLIARARSRPSTWRSCSTRVGLDPTLDAPLPAPVLRRPARAHRHRARAGGEAGVPRLRRVGRGARRVDPGAGAEPVHASCARSSTSPISSSATTSAWSSTSRDRVVDHVPRPRRRSRADRGDLRRAPTTPTRRRCWPRCRAWIRAGKRTFVPIKGEIPSPLDPPPGCHFHPRCPHAMPRCRIEQPLLREIAPLHFSACHLNDGA